MGSATTIIIDKKDILTLNQMEDVELFIGEDIIKAKPSNGEISKASAAWRLPVKKLKTSGQASDELEAAGFTLLGLVGLKDPCRIEVRTAVESCKNAGVKVILVTGDDVRTARATAIECGVFSCDQEDVESDAIVEGVQFSNYSREQRMERSGKILVMGSSSASDKLEMIRCLKEDRPCGSSNWWWYQRCPSFEGSRYWALIGIRGTEVAKESSDIVILDDNFISVVNMLSWGRCVANNIQKFIQFQLTMNVAALVINLISACSSGVLSFSAFQILWEKVIIDTLGLLAVIGHDQPTKDLMIRKPPACWSKRPINESIFNNILIQVFYQAITLSALQFNVGKSILGLAINNTLVFNTSVICQVFNIFTARLPVEKKSMFMWIRKNKRFLAAVLAVTVAQGVIVELSSKVTSCSEKLDRKQWCVSLSIAASSWLFDQLVRRMILPKISFLGS
ncbi:calcium-transporting ATPase 13 [Populus alba x Populus x berolinensis]|nr:calcium-transporting ATPase 13 [Populus alba x Populus x berolinensis]